ncbi:hypothetical protein [Halomarina halobia]|uniref:Uncharacterized protein n=1 Tax=Halomarina halobia TaxID=3033386 RepID=A0ABD6A7G6_9EURY
MQLEAEVSNDAVTGMFAHPQSVATNTNDDAEQAIVTGSTRAGALAFPLGVVVD